MRLKKHFSTLLVERNVINVKQIEEHLDKLTKRIRANAAEAKWIMTTVRKWLINDFEAVIQVKKLSKAAEVEDWVQGALDRGEKVYDVQYSQQIEQMLSHAIDWIRSDEGPRRLDRLSVSQAFDGMKRWDEARERRMRMVKEMGLTEEIHRFKSGCALLKLLDREALKWESKHMSHCVGEGGYDPARYSGIDGIYSIRDKQGKPHVTIEILNGSVNQLQGHGNKTPIAKHFVDITEAFTKGPLKRARFEEYVMNSHGIVMDTSKRMWPIFDLPKGLTIGMLEVDGYGSSAYSDIDLTIPEKTTITGTLNVDSADSLTIEKGCDIKRLTARSVRGAVKIEKSKIGDIIVDACGRASIKGVDPDIMHIRYVEDAVEIENVKVSAKSEFTSTTTGTNAVIKSSSLGRCRIEEISLDLKDTGADSIDAVDAAIALSGRCNISSIDATRTTLDTPKPGAAVKAITFKSTMIDNMDIAGMWAGSIDFSHCGIGELVVGDVDSINIDQRSDVSGSNIIVDDRVGDITSMARDTVNVVGTVDNHADGINVEEI